MLRAPIDLQRIVAAFDCPAPETGCADFGKGVQSSRVLLCIPLRNMSQAGACAPPRAARRPWACGANGYSRRPHPCGASSRGMAFLLRSGASPCSY